MNEKISQDIARLESIVAANKKAALEKENAGA